MDRNELEKIMRLSRLSFDETEYTKLEEEFGKIIAFADTINQVVELQKDLSGTGREPAMLENLREDIVSQSFSSEALLSNAENIDGMFVVKKIRS